MFKRIVIGVISVGVIGVCLVVAEGVVSTVNHVNGWLYQSQRLMMAEQDLLAAKRLLVEEGVAMATKLRAEYRPEAKRKMPPMPLTGPDGGILE